MEILRVERCELRFVVANKGKIVLVTHNRRHAEFLSDLVNRFDWPRSYALSIEKKTPVP